MLPGIDDGCPTWADSVKCVRKLMERGFVGTVCTPHIIADQFPKNIPENIALWVADLQEKLRDLDIQIDRAKRGRSGTAPDTKKSGRRWLDRLGLSGNDDDE